MRLSMCTYCWKSYDGSAVSKCSKCFPEVTPEAPNTVKDVGRKDDQAKSRYDLIPPAALEQIVQALTYGADKYGDDNWQRVDGGRRRYFGALMRHAWAAFRGEPRDVESGLSHWAHAGACVLFLLCPLAGDAVSPTERTGE